MRRVLLLLAVLAGAAGCASPGTRTFYDVAFEPYPADEPAAVLSDEHLASRPISLLSKAIAEATAGGTPTVRLTAEEFDALWERLREVWREQHASEPPGWIPISYDGQAWRLVTATGH